MGENVRVCGVIYRDNNLAGGENVAQSRCQIGALV